jgi:hypothetical protein
MAPGAPTSPTFQGTHGDTSYYFFENPDLPLFGPLRTLGVPEPLIDVVEPFFRVLVELGYDRSIPPWEPTPARLIPTLDPAKVITDLANAIGEGINNALALVGLPPKLRIHAPVTPAAPAATTAKTAISHKVTSTTDGADESSTTAAAEPSASASTPEPAKPAGQPTKPRPVGQQLRNRSDRGDRNPLTTRAAAGGAGASTGARSSTASKRTVPQRDTHDR